MDALPPSLPNAGLPQPAPAATAGLAILLAELSEALAQSLAKLPANSPLTALVTQILPQTADPADPGAPKPQPGTLVQISTPNGPAQIRLPPQVQVTPGAKLDISVSQAGPQPQWRLLAVNDRPATPATISAPPPPSVSTASTPGPPPSVATVQMAPKPPPSPGIPATLVTSSDPALPSGTTLTVRITGLTPPPEQSGPEPETVEETPAPASASPSPTPALATTPATAQTPAPAPAVGAGAETVPEVAPEVEPAPQQSLPPAAPASPAAALAPTPAPTASIAPSPPSPAPAPAAPAPAIAAPASPPQASPQPPTAAPSPVATAAPPPPASSAPPPAPAPAPPPAEVSGQVLPNTDAGKPLVRTPIGLIALDIGPQTLPPDAKVTLQLVGKPVPPPVFTSATPLPDDPPDRILPKRVAQLIDTAQASPAGGDALADAVRERIPAPGQKLAAQLLSAMATADQPQGLARFLGDGLTTALSHAAPQALDSLARHWEAASTPVQGPSEGDWRSLMIPFLMGGEITNLRLTVRQRQGKMAAAEREKGTRFLLDLDLSRLGPMQFDGLVKRQHKRFDLIIRTTTALPGEMRRDIDALFINGLLNFGLEGSVAFHPDGRFVTTPRLTGDANGIIFA